MNQQDKEKERLSLPSGRKVTAWKHSLSHTRVFTQERICTHTPAAGQVPIELSPHIFLYATDLWKEEISWSDKGLLSLGHSRCAVCMSRALKASFPSQHGTLWWLRMCLGHHQGVVDKGSGFAAGWMWDVGCFTQCGMLGLFTCLNPLSGVPPTWLCAFNLGIYSKLVHEGLSTGKWKTQSSPEGSWGWVHSESLSGGVDLVTGCRKSWPE